MSLRSAIASFRANLFDPTAKNSMSVPLGQEFLRYGNRNVITPDWAQVVMSDRDLYTGYMYGALTKRARRAAQIAVDAVKTQANEVTVSAAAKKKTVISHPYTIVIENSPTFSDNSFWHDITTYLDLEGVYYLFVLRTVGEKSLGNPQEFKLLNPYNVTRVKDAANLKVQGYIERHNGYMREIPKEQIIEIRDLNPFSEDDPYSMADAAKDAVFTLKQAGDFTRSSLKHNMKSSGIVSTDLVLNPEQMANFKARILGGNKGEPVFTDAAGGVKYADMQIALDKAALKDVTNLNVESTLVTTGTSKTILGIEVSGVTRDTSETQSELFVTGEIMPRLQVIIDALNQDYRNSYPDDFKKFGYKLFLDSPLGADREAELKDIDIRNKSYNVYAVLVGQGYKRELAADFAVGKIGLIELGAPTETPTKTNLSPDTVTFRESDAPPTALGAVDQVPVTPPTDTPPADKPVNSLTKNAVDAQQALIDAQASTLQNTIVQIEAQVAMAVSKKVTNAFDSQNDVIRDQDRKDNEEALVTALALFYAVILPIQAGMTMSQRAKEYGKVGTFQMTPAVQKVIKESADRAASSHMETILQDLLEAVQVAEVTGGDITPVVEAVQKKYPEESAEAIAGNLRQAAEKASRDGGKEVARIKSISEQLHAKYKETGFDDILAGVREKALAGAEHRELVEAITSEYADISKERASVIAKTETNRAFSNSQFEADKQFLEQNDLTGQAYKQWVTRSPKPCPFCSALASQAPIPFETNFANVGDVLSATVTKADGTTTVRKMPVTYEDLGAGNAHPRCACVYQLIFR